MSVSSKIIDYPYLITIGCIGLLVALAGLMVGIVLEGLALGYIMAAVSLFVTSYTIGRYLLVRGKTATVEQDTRLSAKFAKPQALTSIDGALVYCNMPYRYFVKNGINREILSPVDIMEEGHAQGIKELLSTMEIGAEHSRIIQLITGENEKKYIEVTLSRKIAEENYISWVFSETTSEVPMDINRQSDNGFGLDQMGDFLDRCDCGLVALSQEGEIMYANDILLHWLTGDSLDDMEMPIALSRFCSLSPEKLKGQIVVKTLSGENILLEFVPAGKAVEGRGHKDQNSLNIRPQAPLPAIIYQVFLHQSEIATAKGGVDHIKADHVKIDRFFSESPIGIAIVTQQGEILERNNVFRDYMEALDIKNTRSLRHLIDPDDYKEFYDKIKTMLGTGQAGSLSDVGFKGKGKKHGHIYITRLNKFSGHEDVAILYLIDMTEQKSLELQFAQSQKMQAVGQLAGGIAHDFNNLLTAIIGFSDLLLVRHGPGDQSFSDIIQIKQNANRAANLVRQLLAFSRQQTLRPKILIITDVLAELSNLLGRLIGDNIELVINHGRNLAHVKVDQGQIEQVIINLCVNARDAMDNMGKIIIRTRNISYEESKSLRDYYEVMPPNEYVLLEVEDTGCGISEENMGKIFEPFFSTKEVGKGTGLGLSTVYGIVKQTDGFVFSKSEVGKGTTFSIFIPVYKASDQEKLKVKALEIAEEKPTRDLTGKGTILLVEDEDPVRMFASRALKNKGYNVYEANSGEAALALFQENEAELDLVISDVVMPLMDGPTLVRNIRKTNEKLKVIFISGYAEDAFDKTPGDEDFHFLPKPFSLKQLAEKVKEVMEGD